jgi:hypothetical protein
MMNFRMFLGHIILWAVIGFSLAGCPASNGGEGSGI